MSQQKYHYKNCSQNDNKCEMLNTRRRKIIDAVNHAGEVHDTKFNKIKK